MGSGWGAGAKTLRIVYSTAEYCAPVWCRSAHTRLIDSVLNNALRIVTGCLRPTPTDHLPVLSGIQPAELRRLEATLSLTYRGSLDPDHILYGLLSGSSDTRQVRLRSRRLFVPAARNLLYEAYFVLVFSIILNHVINVHKKRNKFIIGCKILF